MPSRSSAISRKGASGCSTPVEVSACTAKRTRAFDSRHAIRTLSMSTGPPQSQTTRNRDCTKTRDHHRTSVHRRSR
jgi:hypothetical protein